MTFGNSSCEFCLVSKYQRFTKDSEDRLTKDSATGDFMKKVPFATCVH